MSNLFRVLKKMQRSLGGQPGGGGGGGGRRRQREGAGEDHLLRVDPQQTAPELSEWLDPHIIAVRPDVPATGRLVLFLPGSYGHPGRQTAILQTAAAAGHRAINLTYPNSWTVGGLCRKAADPNAHAKVRLQITEGIGESGLISMPPADCVFNRLAKLLLWLRREQPSEIWSEFLSGDQPDWEKIEIAGHSQGGGHAAFIAKRHAVAKVMMLGAPSDHSQQAGGPAPWLYEESATPAERYFGFCHLRDPGYPHVQRAWDLLGMKNHGPIVQTDREPSPYQYSHSLVTDLPAAGDKFHGSVATDAAAPRSANGQIAFLPVWDYLFRS